MEILGKRLLPFSIIKFNMINLLVKTFIIKLIARNECIQKSIANFSVWFPLFKIWFKVSLIKESCFLTIRSRAFISAQLLQKSILKIGVSIFENCHLLFEFSGSATEYIVLRIFFSTINILLFGPFVWPQTTKA